MHNDSPELVSTRRVVFDRAFTLGADPEIYQPGAYVVETTEQMFGARGHTGLRRTSTVLIVPTPTGSFSRKVSGTDLDQAIAQDAIESTAAHLNRGV